MNNKTKKYIIRGSIILTVVLLFLSIYLFITKTQAGGRLSKDISSSVSGMDRTLRAYSLDGELLETYSGKFDISENSNGAKVKFDKGNKRIIIYNAIVIVEEDIDE